MTGAIRRLFAHDHAAHAAAGTGDLPVVVLVGRPNVGKSTFLGSASGTFVESANAPGTTIGSERRIVRVGDAALHLVDLPGMTSLAEVAPSGRPFWSILLGAKPDALVFVSDAGDLARHLPLALACRDLGLPFVFVANFADETPRKGIELDPGRLSQLLAAPVHLAVARDGHGIDEAIGDALHLAEKFRDARRREVAPALPQPAGGYAPQLTMELRKRADAFRADRDAHADASTIADRDARRLATAVNERRISPFGAATIELSSRLEQERWKNAARIAAEVERPIAGFAELALAGAGAGAGAGDAGAVASGFAASAAAGESFAERFGRWAVRPWPGLPIFGAVTLSVLAIMMGLGALLSWLLGLGWGAAVSPVIRAVVHAVIPFDPVARAILWAVDDGVLAMLSVGVPYVLTFYLLLAALEDSGYLTTAAVLTDRILNALGLPGRAAIPILAATGCNVPAIYGTRILGSRRERIIASFVITLTPCSARTAVVAGAIVPFAGLPAAIGAFGIVALLTLAGGLAANALVPGRSSPAILELAPLRRPVPRLVFVKAWARFRAFVVTALPIMIVGSLVLGALYESGLVFGISGLTDPITVGLFGLPSVAGLALLFSFLRKELALQLLATLAIAQLGAGASSLGSFMTPGQLFVYAVVVSISFPCLATFAALSGELGRRVAIAATGGSVAITLVVGALLARLLGVA